MKNEIDDNIHITFLRGGMIEYSETGIYPEKFHVESEKYDAFWEVRLVDKKLEEVLVLNGVGVYNIKFMSQDSKIRIQKLANQKPFSEWVELEYQVLMLD